MKKVHSNNNQALPDSTIAMPFTITLSANSAPYDTLVCEKLMRHLPGKRLACLAHWGNREVFAKLFIDPDNAKRDWLRDSNGSRALLDRKILAPELLYSGSALGNPGGPMRHEGYVLIFDRIAPAPTLLETWNRSDEQAQLKLLHAITGVLAGHHNVGLVHGDLHFANFMIQGENMFTLDGGQIDIAQAPVGKRCAMRNLGLLFAELPPHYDGFADQVFPGYMGLRGWKIEDADRLALHVYIDAARAHRKNKFLKKVFRECSAFVSHQQAQRFTVYDRGYDSLQMRQLLDNPGSYLNDISCEIIKRGNTATLGIVEIDGRKLVIKRYNIKNFRHACKRALQPTRAATSWRNAHLLNLLDIPTPAPVALIEKRLGPLRRESYFISAHVEGVDCSGYFSTASAIEKIEMVKKIVKLFGRLAEAKISHGDMKATNIIVSDHEPVLLDLDAMHQHRSIWRFRKKFARDVQRFLQNWHAMPDILHAFKPPLMKLLREL